jgi:hypothetical protein
MTFKEIERAELAIAAARAAGPQAPAEVMRAIGCCLMNRARQGWHGGSLLKVIEEAAGGNTTQETRLDPEDRGFLRWIREADEVYFGSNLTISSEKQQRSGNVPAQPASTDEALSRAVYWARIDRPFAAWFEEKIFAEPGTHREALNMGVWAFYE